MTSSPLTLSEFAQHLMQDIALPALSVGYQNLVTQLRQNEALAKLAREKDIDAVLASSSEDMAGLKKANKELVTTAEKTAERLMRDEVTKYYPDHAIVGEEHGYKAGSSTRWVFDPVDGTSAMIRTAMAEAFDLPLPVPAPAFGVTIALVEGDHATLGVIAELRPHNGGLAAVNTWIGEAGKPSTLNGAPIPLPLPKTSLAQASLASTVPPVMFNTKEKWSGYQALLDATGKPCVTDQNCIGFMRLLRAEGGIDVVYEADLAYHDAAALVPILAGAGVKVTDNVGAALSFPESAISQEFNLICAQPALHTLTLQHIAQGVAPAQNRFAENDGMHQGYAAKFPL